MAYIHPRGDVLYAGVSGDKYGYVGEWYNYSASSCELSVEGDSVTRVCLSSDERTVDERLSIVEEKEIVRYRVDAEAFTRLSVERYKREGVIEPGQDPSIDEKAWVAY